MALSLPPRRPTRRRRQETCCYATRLSKISRPKPQRQRRAAAVRDGTSWRVAAPAPPHDVWLGLAPLAKLEGARASGARQPGAGRARSLGQPANCSALDESDERRAPVRSHTHTQHALADRQTDGHTDKHTRRARTHTRTPHKRANEARQLGPSSNRLFCFR